MAGARQVRPTQGRRRNPQLLQLLELARGSRRPAVTREDRQAVMHQSPVLRTGVLGAVPARAAVQDLRRSLPPVTTLENHMGEHRARKAVVLFADDSEADSRLLSV